MPVQALQTVQYDAVSSSCGSGDDGVVAGGRGVGCGVLAGELRGF
jgi:hypothetical protein